MRKISVLTCLLAFLLVGVTSTTSCSRKTGCPVNEEAHFKAGKNGKLPKKGGSSNLFPKKMRRKTKGK